MSSVVEAQTPSPHVGYAVVSTRQVVRSKRKSVSRKTRISLEYERKSRTARIRTWGVPQYLPSSQTETALHRPAARRTFYQRIKHKGIKGGLLSAALLLAGWRQAGPIAVSAPVGGSRGLKGRDLARGTELVSPSCAGGLEVLEGGVVGAGRAVEAAVGAGATVRGAYETAQSNPVLTGSASA
jgi:hypothetical protein